MPLASRPRTDFKRAGVLPWCTVVQYRGCAVDRLSTDIAIGATLFKRTSRTFLPSRLLTRAEGPAVNPRLCSAPLKEVIQEFAPIGVGLPRQFTTPPLSPIDLPASATMPSELIDAAARQGRDRADRREGLPADVVIPLDRLKPESAFDNPGTWSVGSSSRSFGGHCHGERAPVSSANALPQMPSRSALPNAPPRSGHRRSSPTPSSRHSHVKS